VQLRVYVASNQGFTDQSLIANGVSDMMVAIFGEAGRHVRVAIGSIGLPLGATVEVEASFKISLE
jgi:enamine deaminase RidA (YjgF/YER057c/UK114 family)